MVALKKAYESKHCDSLQAVSLNRIPISLFPRSERIGRRGSEVAGRDHRRITPPMAEVESQRSNPLVSLTTREPHRRCRHDTSSGGAGKERLFAERAVSFSFLFFPFFTRRKRSVAILAGPHRPAPRGGKIRESDRAGPLLSVFSFPLMQTTTRKTC